MWIKKVFRILICCHNYLKVLLWWLGSPQNPYPAQILAFPFALPRKLGTLTNAYESIAITCCVHHCIFSAPLEFIGFFKSVSCPLLVKQTDAWVRTTSDWQHSFGFSRYEKGSLQNQHQDENVELQRCAAQLRPAFLLLKQTSSHQREYQSCLFLEIPWTITKGEEEKSSDN